MGLFVSCGPSEQQEEKLKMLVADWKNSSDKIVSISEKIGDQMYLLESKKSAEDGSEMISLTIDGEESTCEAEYSAMKEKVDDFIEVWRENSLKVDELTNRMAIGKWTIEEDENLSALDLEAKKGEVNIEQWEIKLEELASKCQINPESSSS